MQKAVQVHRFRQLSPLEIQSLSVASIRQMLDAEKEPTEEANPGTMILSGWEELIINDVLRVSVRADVPEESRTKILQGLADGLVNEI